VVVTTLAHFSRLHLILSPPKSPSESSKLSCAFYHRAESSLFLRLNELYEVDTSGVLRFSPIKQGESLNSEISLSFLAIISEEADHTRALNGDRARERGAGNRVDAPRKRERRRRERRREKKYDFTVCVQTYFLFTTKRTNT